MMLRMAIVGVGWAGTRQAEAVRELGRKVSLHCLVDSDEAYLAATADKLAVAKTYKDYAAALADPDVDAVSICTPHALHCAMTLEAAEAGKHILCEKPMAMTVAQATQMIDAAEAHGVTLYVAESAVYTPMAQRLREIVQSGEYLGELTSAAIVAGFRAPDYGYPGRRAWLSEPALGGTGTWMLHGIHSMAQLRYVLGEVATVYMGEHHTRSFSRPEIEGTMSGLFTLGSGVHVWVVQTCETRLKGDLRGYTLHGDRGSVRASHEGYAVYPLDWDGDQPPQSLSYPEAVLSSYALELEAFADTVAGRRVGPTTGRDERRSLAIVQAGHESAQSGQPIRLADRFGEL